MTNAPDHARPFADRALHSPGRAATRGAGVARSLLTVALTLLVLGCAQEPPASPAPAVEASQPAAADPVVAEVEAPMPDSAAAVLPADAVTVDTLPDCGETQITTVRWNESAFTAGPITIWIEGAQRGLFAKAAGPGEKETGPWATPGMVFVVTDIEERELSRVPVTAAIACD